MLSECSLPFLRSRISTRRFCCYTEYNIVGSWTMRQMNTDSGSYYDMSRSSSSWCTGAVPLATPARSFVLRNSFCESGNFEAPMQPNITTLARERNLYEIASCKPVRLTIHLHTKVFLCSHTPDLAVEISQQRSQPAVDFTQRRSSKDVGTNSAALR